MKKIGRITKLLLFILPNLFIQNIQAQWKTLYSNNHASVLGYAIITNGGCEYAGAVQNNSGEYVWIDKSQVTAKFKYEKWSEASEKYKTYHSTKNVNIKPVFLKPNSNASKDKDRDDGSNKTYIAVASISGELGNTVTGHANQVSEDDAIELKIQNVITVYEDDNIKINVEIGSDGFGAMTGFYHYPAKIDIVNKTSLKLKYGDLSFRLYYQGVYNDYTKNIGKIKPFGIQEIRENFDGTQFNFEPKIFFKLNATPYAI